MKQTNKGSGGTAFYGNTIVATVNKLKSVLGEPAFDFNDGCDKVNFDWVAETDNGDVFTVYDWKYYRPLALDETVTFNIGGNNKRVTEQAEHEIIGALLGLVK